jgi:hypothetical protein
MQGVPDDNVAGGAERAFAWLDNWYRRTPSAKD